MRQPFGTAPAEGDSHGFSGHIRFLDNVTAVFIAQIPSSRNWMISALEISMKNAPTSGTTTNAFGEAPNFLAEESDQKETSNNFSNSVSSFESGNVST